MFMFHISAKYKEHIAFVVTECSYNISMNVIRLSAPE